MFAFVVHEDETSFRLFGADLSWRRGSATAERSGFWEHVTYERVDLAAEARAFAEAARVEQEADDWMAPWPSVLTARAELVVLARALERRGDAAACDALLAVANVLRGARDWDRVNTRLSLRERVEADLETALRQLPDGARTVFVLHDIEGYRHEEIGRMLRVATGTSKTQLHRARKLLREALRS